ncbi:FBP domain-containing protein [Kocuria sp.]|uniref:FBP domain-containing protein n=1 Tax=Kocuria sp. TaxID=1871328 RepID=UPI0026DFD7D6|nr:FBP domain-containing protein [Kocuria sp.]MDO5619763.1 FBP domain-containing protein [Kocuria sp.]
MLTHTESAIRKSFVNCSTGEAQRLNSPSDLLENMEDRLSLAWIDPPPPHAVDGWRTTCGSLIQREVNQQS